MYQKIKSKWVEGAHKAGADWDQKVALDFLANSIPPHPTS